MKGRDANGSTSSLKMDCLKIIDGGEFCRFYTDRRFAHVEKRLRASTGRNANASTVQALAWNTDAIKLHSD